MPPSDKQRIRSELINRWSVAKAKLATSAKAGHRFASLAVNSDSGVPGLAAALVVDTQARAILLPGSSLSAVATEKHLDTALVLEEQRLENEDGTVRSYISVFSIDDRWNDIFCELAVDIIVHVQADPANAVPIIEGRVEHWRAFFNSRDESDKRAMSIEKETGLFGELTVVQQLMRRSDRFDPSRHWSGPRRHYHDFDLPHGAIEVKSTISVDSQNITVNGDRQLCAPLNGPLVLTFVRLLENGPSATAIPQLVLAVCDALTDPIPFLDLLQSVGVHLSAVFSDDDETNFRRFQVIDIQWCFIDDRIPRIIASSFSSGEVPVGVTEIQYSTSIAGAEWWTSDEVQPNIVSLLESDQ